jgi:hypothetical protein
MRVEELARAVDRLLAELAAEGATVPDPTALKL